MKTLYFLCLIIFIFSTSCKNAEPIIEDLDNSGQQPEVDNSSGLFKIIVNESKNVATYNLLSNFGYEIYVIKGNTSSRNSIIYREQLLTQKILHKRVFNDKVLAIKLLRREGSLTLLNKTFRSLTNAEVFKRNNSTFQLNQKHKWCYKLYSDLCVDNKSYLEVWVCPKFSQIGPN